MTKSKRPRARPADALDARLKSAFDAVQAQPVPETVTEPFIAASAKPPRRDPRS